MLSRCSPFTTRIKYAEGVLGAPICVWAIIGSPDRTLRVDLSGSDTQTYTNWDGVVNIVHGRDIREIVATVGSLYPGFRVISIEVFVSTGEIVRSAGVDCRPLNPELIATVSRKLIRGLYGA